MENFLREVIRHPPLHARWLNTLSYLENCGARKIARCQHATLVREEMLKHAAEEFRHAHHLKRQIARLPYFGLTDYRTEYLLGGRATLHYLHALDIQTCRYLQTTSAHAAYLLVTHAIEQRAMQLYPLYDRLLKEARSRVTVKCILMEEQEHLAEMERGLQTLFPDHNPALHICALENQLYNAWLPTLFASLK